MDKRPRETPAVLILPAGKAFAGRTRKVSKNISGKAVKKLNPDTASERKDVPP
ncbi:hypothetical protein CE91St47_12930 [Eubacteriales bacterium]|nr:hypothetical protein CE91St47_12930 [Eubacteriales bacterium]